MTRLLPLLSLSPCRKFRPTSPAASSAHLRWYSILRSGQSDSTTSDFQRREQSPISEHVSPEDRMYPRITSQNQVIHGGHFRGRYNSLQPDEVDEKEEVILRGTSHGLIKDD